MPVPNQVNCYGISKCLILRSEDLGIVSALAVSYADKEAQPLRWVMRRYGGSGHSSEVTRRAGQEQSVSTTRDVPLYAVDHHDLQVQVLESRWKY